MNKTDKKGCRKCNKIEPIHIAEEMIADPDMDRFLRQSVIEEADRLEKELNSDPELVGVGASDDLFLKIKAQLQEMGVWEEDGDGGETGTRERSRCRKTKDTEAQMGGSVRGNIKIRKKSGEKIRNYKRKK